MRSFPVLSGVRFDDTSPISRSLEPERPHGGILDGEGGIHTLLWDFNTLGCRNHTAQQTTQRTSLQQDRLLNPQLSDDNLRTPPSPSTTLSSDILQRKHQKQVGFLVVPFRKLPPNLRLLRRPKSHLRVVVHTPPPPVIPVIPLSRLVTNPLFFSVEGRGYKQQQATDTVNRTEDPFMTNMVCQVPSILLASGCIYI